MNKRTTRYFLWGLCTAAACGGQFGAPAVIDVGLAQVAAARADPLFPRTGGAAELRPLAKLLVMECVTGEYQAAWFQGMRLLRMAECEAPPGKAPIDPSPAKEGLPEGQPPPVLDHEARVQQRIRVIPHGALSAPSGALPQPPPKA